MDDSKGNMAGLSDDLATTWAVYIVTSFGFQSFGGQSALPNGCAVYVDSSKVVLKEENYSVMCLRCRIYSVCAG
jgi:hypothetical protein